MVCPLKAATLSILESSPLRPNHRESLLERSADNQSWTTSSHRHEMRRSCWEQTLLRVVRTKRNQSKPPKSGSEKSQRRKFCIEQRWCRESVRFGLTESHRTTILKVTWWKIWIGRGESCNFALTYTLYFNQIVWFE